MKDEIRDYRHLPVGKWAEIQAVCADESREELDRQVAVLAILGDMTEEEVLDLPLLEYKQRVVDASFLTSADGLGAYRSARRYICGDFKLVPCMDAKKITAAQYIDFQEYADKGDSAIVEALSCLLVPEGHKYMDGYDITQLQEAIRENMSTYDAMGLCAFFLSKSVKYLRRFLTYSDKAAKKAPKTVRESLKEKVSQIRRTLSQVAGGGSQT